MAIVKIEFAGLVVAVVPSAPTLVNVALLDARSVGGPDHSAVMLVLDHEGLKGVPDFTITSRSAGAGTEVGEYAGWFLRGDVTFAGDFAAFQAPRLDKTMDLKKVADATGLAPPNQRSISATVLLDAGQLTSGGFEALFDFKHDPGTGEERIYNQAITLSDRLICDLGDVTQPFKVSFTGKDGRHCVVTIADTVKEPIVISNLVGGAGNTTAHFEAYYELAPGTRKPWIVRYLADGTVMQFDWPDNPDECRTAKFEF